MRISEVTNADGRLCAQLINLLKAGKWELSGPDIAAHSDTVKWVHMLAGLMAEQLRNSKRPDSPKPAQPQMRVKSAGLLPGAGSSVSSAASRKRSRKKK